MERGEGDLDGLPAMGYLHVDGLCQSTGGGSRHNLLEAETIAAWLAERKQKLEETYRKPLTEIVGVVTPFNAQVRAITHACRKLGITAGAQRGDMTVGTVHALQGAQRPVVIFSPVYSKHADGGFIDQSSSILNVAVSRAKNSFLVFGDMDTFELVPREKPRGQLATLLFSDDANELRFDYQPRRDLATSRTGVSQLCDAREHDMFLLDVIEKAAREVHIVTPWIRFDCVREIGALDAMAAAVSKGVKVCVYTDLGSNTYDRNPAILAAKRRELQAVVDALGAERISAVLVWKVHSKIVIGDENVYCVGSFNWFSARRDEARARHETSLVYRGRDLVKEIDVMKKSLQRRVAHFQL
jgi:phosphatidylserine/phosphatidylglycerophosphate/cardiolipin synthase-like enzyme